MKVRVGNACWHAGHVTDVFVAQEAGFFAEEGLDAEVVSGCIYNEGIKASRPGDYRYDESPYVLRDMIRFNIDIVTDVELATVCLDKISGRDELRLIGVWRNRLVATLMSAPHVKSLRDLKGKRIGVWVKGTEVSRLIELQLQKAGLDPSRDVEWVVGYKFGSNREAAGPLREGKTDAAIVRLDWVPQLQEDGFNKLVDFMQVYPHGRPARSTVARQSFIDRNPEIIKRYWKAAIRAYHFIRIVPDHYPFLRYCEAKLRTNNPDENEMQRNLRPMSMYESWHGSMNGQPSMQGLADHFQESKETGKVPESFTFEQLQTMLRLELVQEAWEELCQRDETKRNLERIQPLIERFGF
ncbi:MAG: ABC transporter substrate-binding protein [Deltaproteobacteria bacterium]|nr:ABC transporter substrate-binding protein [Deltaproteobacteria bacterium]